MQILFIQTQAERSSNTRPVLEYVFVFCLFPVEHQQIYNFGIHWLLVFILAADKFDIRHSNLWTLISEIYLISMSMQAGIFTVRLNFRSFKCVNCPICWTALH